MILPVSYEVFHLKSNTAFPWPHACYDSTCIYVLRTFTVCGIIYVWCLMSTYFNFAGIWSKSCNPVMWPNYPLHCHRAEVLALCKINSWNWSHPLCVFYKCLNCVVRQCLQEDTSIRMYQCSVRRAALIISRLWLDPTAWTLASLCLRLSLYSSVVILVLTLGC